MNNIELSKQFPIEVVDNKQLIILYTPEKEVLENISVIWTMLENVTLDWKAISRAYPTSFAGIKEEDRRRELEFNAFEQLKPRLFQCLFSYIVFFFMLENGYHFVYSELNRLNQELGLRISHRKLPERTDFVKALWKLRNFTIAHWAGTEKKTDFNSIAGRKWGYGFGHSIRHKYWAENIERIIPLFQGVVIASIPDTHARCSKYLENLDQICTNYLKALAGQMPKTHDEIEYHSWKYTKSGLVYS